MTKFILTILCCILYSRIESRSLMSQMSGGMGGLVPECMKKCLSKIELTEAEFDFTTSTNYGKHLIKIDETCESIADASKCLDECDDLPINPLKLKSIEIMCSEEMKKKMRTHSDCYNSQGDIVYKFCDEKCSNDGYDFHNDEFLKSILSSETSSNFNFGDTMSSLGDACRASKCQVRCHRDKFIQLCADTDPNAGTSIQEFSETILDALNEDLADLGMTEIMQKMMPSSCDFMFKSKRLFNGEIGSDEQDEKVNDFNDMFESLFNSASVGENEDRSSRIFEKTDELLNGEMRVLEKRNRNFELENKKLQMEIALLREKLKE